MNQQSEHATMRNPETGRFIAGEATPFEKRFWSKVRKTDGCWIWTAGCQSMGYGLTSRGPRKHLERLLAHRVAYQLLIGPIPDGLVLDHTCRNKKCVNPAHLEPVTGRVNILRGTSFSALNAAKTRCNRGHELSGANLYRDPDGSGRRCRACMRLNRKQSQ